MFFNFQHKHYVTEAKNEDPDVILIGASIIQFIQSYPIWDDKFKPLNSLNFGISGDRVEDVLWRVQNDLLDHIKPKVVIFELTNSYYLIFHIFILIFFVI